MSSGNKGGLVEFNRPDKAETKGAFKGILSRFFSKSEADSTDATDASSDSEGSTPQLSPTLGPRPSNQTPSTSAYRSDLSKVQFRDVHAVGPVSRSKSRGRLSGLELVKRLRSLTFSRGGLGEPSNIPRVSSQVDLTSRDHWMPDTACKNCYECEATFTLFRRRHHCRICGHVFCKSCCSQYLSGELHGVPILTPLRTCNYCHQQLTSMEGFGEDSEVRSRAQSRVLRLGAAATADGSLDSELDGGDGDSPKEGPLEGAGSPRSAGAKTPTQRKSPSATHTSPHSAAHANSPDNDIEDSTKGISPSESDYEYSESDDELPDDEDEDAAGGSAKDAQEFEHASAGDGVGSGGEGIASEIHPASTVATAQAVVDLASSVPDSFGFSSPNKRVYTEGRRRSQTRSGYVMTTYTAAGRSPHVGSEGFGLLPIEGEGDALPAAMDTGLDTSGVFSGAGDLDTASVGRASSLAPIKDVLMHTPFLDECDGDADNEAEPGDAHAAEKAAETASEQSTEQMGTSDQLQFIHKHRISLEMAAQSHLQLLLETLLTKEDIPADTRTEWKEILMEITLRVVRKVRLNVRSGGDKMDIRNYIKVKKISGGKRKDSCFVDGVWFQKNIAHKKMETKIESPSFLLLQCALEYQRRASQLTSLDTLLSQESEHLRILVQRIQAHSPSVVVVEKNVSRVAQELLLKAGITLLLNVKPSLMDRIARLTGGELIESTTKIQQPILGSARHFQVRYIGGKPYTCIEGCNSLGCTVILRGEPDEEVLCRLKKILLFMCFAAYSLQLELDVCADQCGSYAHIYQENPMAIDPSNTKCVECIRGAVQECSKTSPFLSSSPFVRYPPCPPQMVALSQNALQSIYGTQHLPVLFTKYDTSSTDYEPPKILVISFYSDTDMTLGQYLEETLFRKPVQPDLAGPNASSSGSLNNGSQQENENQNLTVIRTYNHNLGRITITVNRCPSKIRESLHKISSSHSQKYSHANSGLFMWSYCRRCRGQVSPCLPMTDNTWHYSFGKFLEISFYNRSLMNTTRNCRHCVHTDLIRIFSNGDFLARFEYDSIQQYSVAFQLQKPVSPAVPNPSNATPVLTAAAGKHDGKLRSNKVALHNDCDALANAAVSAFRDLHDHLSEIAHDPIYGTLSTAWSSILTFEGGALRAYLEQSESCRQARMLVHHRRSSDDDLASIKARIDVGSASRSALPPFPTSSTASPAKTARSSVNLSNGGGEIPDEPEDRSPTVSVQRLAIALLRDKYVSDKNRHVQQMKALRESFGVGRDPVPGSPQQEPAAGIATGRQDGIAYLSLCNLTRDLFDDLYEWNNILRCLHTLARDILLSHSHKPAASFTAPDVLQAVPASDENANTDTESAETRQDLSGSETNSPTAFPQDGFMKHRRSFSADGFFIAKGAKASSEDEEEEEESVQDVSDSNVVTEVVTGPKKKDHRKEFVQSITSPGHNHPLNWPRPPEIAIPHLLNPAFSPLVYPERTLTSNPMQPGVIYYREVSSVLANVLSSSEYHQYMSGVPTTPVDSVASTPPRGDSVNTSLGPVDIPSPSPHTPQRESDSLAPAESTDDLMDSLKPAAEAHKQPQLSERDRELERVLNLVSSKSEHFKYRFAQHAQQGAPPVRFSCTVYFPEQFAALRQYFFDGDFDFIASLTRSTTMKTTGGKSGASFLSTLDGRFVLKQISRSEHYSFLEFASSYFEYMARALFHGLPTILVKVLGIYRIVMRVGTRESKRVVIVMENLFYNRSISKVFDLKGSMRNRLQKSEDAVQWDENMVRFMYSGNPIVMHEKAKERLSTCIFNDTLFLSRMEVMDYSLLVGVDEDKRELVIGIIDYLRQYSWDKQLESYVKSTRFMGGGKGEKQPTVISPKNYKLRFREAMKGYFLKVPDRYGSLTVHSVKEYGRPSLDLARMDASASETSSRPPTPEHMITRSGSDFRSPGAVLGEGGNM